MYIIYFVLFVCYNSYHLKNYQIKIIDNLIKNPNLEIYQRNKINEVLFISYKKWAIKKACNFKKLHRYKCKNIHINDLIICSKFGLFKAIEKYNGSTSLHNYADIYVKSELLKRITQEFSFLGIPRNILKKNKSKMSEKDLLKYKELLNKKIINTFPIDKIQSKNSIEKLYENNEKYKIIWSQISNLDSFTKRIYFLKYDFELNKIRSNKHISELMCCSEENIRKRITDTIHIFTNYTKITPISENLF